MNQVVYVCSPFRADTKAEKKRNREYAKWLTRQVLLNGDSPITPHLYMTKCLDDDIPDERSLGMRAGKELIKRCSLLLVGEMYGISKGMKEEIEFAEAIKIQIMRVNGE